MRNFSSIIFTSFNSTNGLYYIFCKEVPDEELEETVANSYRKD